MSTNKKKKEPTVAEFMNELEHPLKDAIEEVRIIILSTNDQITEHIKWNAPSFCFQQEDRVTFNFHGKGFFRLVFHCGAKKKEDAAKERLIDDPSGLLDWVENDRAVIQFTDMNDVKAKKEKLAQVVTKWIEAASS